MPAHSKIAALECGDMSPLSHWETCLPVPKRSHACALQKRSKTGYSWLQSGKKVVEQDGWWVMILI